ncbi:hypothetical protein J4234_01765 [Candidatus Woesearchaeota archaeon]|nr:hypothetical protein [Candidatus Woesearchaeota archaeon]
MTWKSTCGGYVYTTIDGYNENAEFACTTQTKSCTDSDGLDMYTKGQVYGPLDAFGSSRQGQVGYANDFCLQMKEGQFPWTYDPEWNDNDVLSNDYTEVCEKECAVYEMICFNNGKAITPSGQASICPAGCKSGACVPTSKPVCGNKICESGEADYCPPCSKEEGIACSCSVGTCPSDCATQKCTDSDGGMNYYEYGYITFFNNNPSENPNLLNEKSCRSDGQAIENLYECTYGCFEGACKMMPEPTTLKEQVTCIFSNSKATQSCYANNKEGSSCSGYDSCTVTISGEKGTQLTWKSTCGGYAYTTIDGYSKKIGFDCLSSCPEGCSCYEGKIVECTPGAYPCKEGCTCDTHGQVLYCGKNECIDSDGGKNYYEKGYVTMTYPNEVFKDKCAADEASPEKADYYRNLLYETYCYDSKQYAYADYQCPYGCSDGTCKKMELKPTEKPIEIPKKERKDRPAESVKEPPEPSEKDYVCAGCELDDKCYPFGYRKDNKFCSDNYKFTSQIKEEEKCDNNFECSSNLCIDSKCVSSGFIQKILSWFKGFFS